MNQAEKRQLNIDSILNMAVSGMNLRAPIV